MATIEEVRSLIREKYDKYFELIYENFENISKSEIDVEESELHSEYKCSENTIYIRLPDGDIEAADKTRVIGLHRWESDLIHEMIHEYVCKTESEPTQEGFELQIQHPYFFLDHDKRFYSAIYFIHRALRNCLNLDFKKFLEEIRSGF